MRLDYGDGIFRTLLAHAVIGFGVVGSVVVLVAVVKVLWWVIYIWEW